MAIAAVRFTHLLVTLKTMDFILTRSAVDCFHRAIATAVFWFSHRRVTFNATPLIRFFSAVASLQRAIAAAEL